MVSVYVLAVLTTILAGAVAFALFGADQLFAGKNEELMKQLKEKDPESPFMDEKIADEMKDAIEPILRTWQTADKNQLPLQMDRGFRERILQTIYLLKKVDCAENCGLQICLYSRQESSTISDIGMTEEENGVRESLRVPLWNAT